MEWWLILLIIFGSLVIVMVTGMPIAFCFMLINVVGVYLLFGDVGLEQLILSIYTGLATFILEPIPLFILMGEFLFESGIGGNVIDAVNKWMGRVPGRLGLLAIASGTLLGALSGVSVACVAILGSALVPEMKKRGYKNAMSIGPVLSSGGLDVMIPPSAIAVFLAAIGEISIGKFLVAIVVPGLLLAGIYAAYIIIRCSLQPSLAPAYDVPPTPLSEKFVASLRCLLPIGVVFFLVIGVIMLGVASPSEAAATGTLGIFIIAFFEKRLNMEVVKKSVKNTLITTGMLFLILAGSRTYGEILSYTGATRGLAEFVMGLQVAPMLIVCGMQVVFLILGCFIDSGSIVMLTIPIFMPIVRGLGFDVVWFGTISLISIEMGLITPPFGLSLFVMKGVAPPDTTMGDIIRAGLPFVFLQFIALGLIMTFPSIALWLPGVMVK
jgi:tripartite ATP-independent transporter DctM subunit